ncbi:MAG: response regulator [Ferruginibacter sp.]
MPIYNKIVLVDDDRDDIELFQSVIQETCPNVQLTVTTNGEKLIYLLKEIPTPDIILLDLNMPIKDGKQCLAEIRAKAEYNNIAVAMFSTSGRKADIDFCLSNGADHYFVKPQTYTGLIAFVQNLCLEN